MGRKSAGTGPETRRRRLNDAHAAVPKSDAKRPEVRATHFGRSESRGNEITHKSTQGDAIAVAIPNCSISRSCLRTGSKSSSDSEQRKQKSSLTMGLAVQTLKLRRTNSRFPAGRKELAHVLTLKEVNAEVRGSKIGRNAAALRQQI